MHMNNFFKFLLCAVVVIFLTFVVCGLLYGVATILIDYLHWSQDVVLFVLVPISLIVLSAAVYAWSSRNRG